MRAARENAADTLYAVPERRLILVGMMGSGKTTVGRLLAKEIGWHYLDNDELLANATKMTPREIAKGGEEAVRRAETQALLLGLAAAEPCIVGAAAGTILDADNRARLRDAGTVIWLRAKPETLARRALGAAHRPWLARDALVWMVRTAAERDELYRSVADVILDVDQRSPNQTASLILADPAVSRLMAST